MGLWLESCEQAKENRGNIQRGEMLGLSRAFWVNEAVSETAHRFKILRFMRAQAQPAADEPNLGFKRLPRFEVIGLVAPNMGSSSR